MGFLRQNRHSESLLGIAVRFLSLVVAFGFLLSTACLDTKTVNIAKLNHLMTKIPRLFEFVANHVS